MFLNVHGYAWRKAVLFLYSQSSLWNIQQFMTRINVAFQSQDVFRKKLRLRNDVITSYSGRRYFFAIIKRSKLASLNSHELLCLNFSKEFIRADCIWRFFWKEASSSNLGLVMAWNQYNRGCHKNWFITEFVLRSKPSKFTPIRTFM